VSARLSVAVSLGSNLYFFVVQFATGIILAQLLTPAEMGVYAVAMAAYWIINAFQNLGLSTLLVRERDLTPSLLGTVYAVGAAQALLLAGLLFATAPAIAAFTGSPAVTEAVRIQCLYALTSAVHMIAGGLLMRRMDFVRFNLSHIVAVTVSAGVTIWLALRGFSSLSMPWGSVAGSLAGSAGALWFARRDLAARPVLSEWDRVWRFGSALLTANLILNITSRAPDLLLARLSGVAATGLYNRAAGLVDVFTNSVIASFQRVMQTLFAQNLEATGDFRDAYVRSVAIITGLVWPAYTGLAVLATPVIALLYGDKWLAAGPALSLICAAAVISAAMTCRSQAMIAAGEERRLPRLEAVRGVIGVGLFAALAPFGLVAAAASRIVEAVAGVAIFARHVHRAAGVGGSDMLRPYVSSLVVTAAAAAPAVAVMAAFGWPARLPPVWLVTSIVAGGAAWLAAVFLARHELSGEIRRALARLRPARPAAPRAPR